MTIAARRRTYWTLFLAACACLVAFFPLYARLVGAGEAPAFLARADALRVLRIGEASIPSHYLAAAGIGLCALYSALCLGYILYSFRKTVSSEVYFFAFWVLSVGLEALRMGSFALAAGSASIYWQIAAAKALLFARYGGYLSLFVSGLYASGFRNEKLGTVVAIAMALAIGLAAAMPVNTGAFAPTLELKAGYSDISAALSLTVALIVAADFLYAAHSTGEPSYRLVALGTAILAVGQRLLVAQWNPVAIVAGFVLLAAGSWLFVSRLHAYYLWQ